MFYVPCRLSLEIVQGSGDDARLRLNGRWRINIVAEIVVARQWDGWFLGGRIIVGMPTIAHVLQLLQVFATALFLVQFFHLFGLAIGQLGFGHGVLVLEPNGRLVVNVDVTFNIAPCWFCACACGFKLISCEIFEMFTDMKLIFCIYF